MREEFAVAVAIVLSAFTTLMKCQVAAAGSSLEDGGYVDGGEAGRTLVRGVWIYVDAAGAAWYLGDG